jgi:hypothetical protein
MTEGIGLIIVVLFIWVQGQDHIPPDRCIQVPVDLKDHTVLIVLEDEDK